MQPRIQFQQGIPAILNQPITFNNPTFFNALATFNAGTNAAFFQTGANQVIAAGLNGSTYANANFGMVLQGRTGAVNDVGILDPTGVSIWRVPTGTQDSTFTGSVSGVFFQTTASSSVNAGKSGSVYYNSSNGMILQAKTGIAYDLLIENPSTAIDYIRVPTGSNVPVFPQGLGNLQKIQNSAYTNAAPSVGDSWFDATQQTLASVEGAAGSTLILYKSGTLAAQKQAYTVNFAVAGTFYDLTPAAAVTNTLNLPANFFVQGKTIRAQVAGSFTTGAIAPQFQTRMLQGGSNLELNAVTLLANTAYKFNLEMVVTCFTPGAAGVAVCGICSILTCQQILVSPIESIDPVNQVATFQTTASAALDIQGMLSQNANQSVTVNKILFEVLN
jgi:hypothetical protein